MMRLHEDCVAAGDPATVQAAEEILRAGGNAFDAAVGAAFVSMVAEPVLTSPGGGGHMLAVPSQGAPLLLDFFVNMPSGRSPLSRMDFFPVEIDFGTARQRFYVGRASCAAPGNIAGLLHAQSKLGVMTRKQVMEPAISLASDGVRLSAVQKGLFQILKPILCLTPSSPLASYLENQGNGLLVQPELSDFLEAISREGPDLFYKGEIAQSIVEWSAPGGLITRQDLARYRVVERPPLQTRFCGANVLLNPPPAQSGILIQFTLSLLADESLEENWWRPLLVALEATARARREYCTPGVGQLPASLNHPRLLSRFREEAATAFQVADETETPGPGHTTHISILDRFRNAASLTTTNGEGCGFAIPGLGFMLNNMLGEEDLNPDGFHRYRAGSRLSSMMAPTILLRDGNPWLVTGSAGSNRIRSAVIQILLHLLIENRTLDVATLLPRIHLENGILHSEPGIPEELLTWASSRLRLQEWPDLNPFFGGANSVMPGQAAGDPRRGGVGKIITASR